MEKRFAPITLALFAVIMIAACSIAAFVVARLTVHQAQSADDVATFRWLHKELGLTPQEESELASLEQDYRAERERLQKEFEAAKQKLAEILASNDAYSESATHAVHEIHIVHGNLQELAIRHYYEMLARLPEDKQSRLRQIAVRALSEPE